MSKIYGVALNAAGDPVAGVAVEVTSPAGEVQRFTTGEGGIFEAEASAGTWSLKWTPTEGSPGEGTVEVAEGEDAEIEIEVS
jgi:hypothetical protein